jgi:hypothetical protein
MAGLASIRLEGMVISDIDRILMEEVTPFRDEIARLCAALAMALYKTNFYAAENDQLTDRALRPEQALQDMKIKLTQSEQTVSARGKSFVALLDERNRAKAALAEAELAIQRLTVRVYELHKDDTTLQHNGKQEHF